MDEKRHKSRHILITFLNSVMKEKKKIQTQKRIKIQKKVKTTVKSAILICNTIVMV